MAYMVIYTYTAELYNTKIRVLSMGFFNFISKISGVAMLIDVLAIVMAKLLKKE